MRGRRATGSAPIPARTGVSAAYQVSTMPEGHTGHLANSDVVYAMVDGIPALHVHTAAVLHPSNAHLPGGFTLTRLDTEGTAHLYRLQPKTPESAALLVIDPTDPRLLHGIRISEIETRDVDGRSRADHARLQDNEAEPDAAGRVGTSRQGAHGTAVEPP